MTALAKRQAVIAIHALGETLRQVAAGASEPGIARGKLAWWTGELEGLRSDAAHHPVARALAARAPVEKLQPVFTAMLGAVEIAIQDDGFARLVELEHYAQALGGQACVTEQLTCASSDASVNAESLAAAAQIGKALELMQLFRPGPAGPLELAWMLPGDVLADAGVSDTDLRAGATPPALQRALVVFADRIAQLLTPAPEENVAFSALTASLRARREMALANLQVLRRANFAVLDRRLGISPLRKLWIGWRAVRRGA